MLEKYKNHWHSSSPSKGSAYRSIYLSNFLDPIVQSACQRANIDPQVISAVFQKTDLYLFVDPFCTSFRKGPNNRVTRVLYEYDIITNKHFYPNLDITLEDLMDLNVDLLLKSEPTDINNVDVQDVIEGNSIIPTMDLSNPPPNLSNSQNFSSSDTMDLADGLSELLIDLNYLSSNHDIYGTTTYGPYEDLPYHITITRCNHDCDCRTAKVVTQVNPPSYADL